MNENGEDKINKIKEMKRRFYNGIVMVFGCVLVWFGIDCWCWG